MKADIHPDYKKTVIKCVRVERFNKRYGKKN